MFRIWKTKNSILRIKVVKSTRVAYRVIIVLKQKKTEERAIMGLIVCIFVWVLQNKS